MHFFSQSRANFLLTQEQTDASTEKDKIPKSSGCVEGPDVGERHNNMEHNATNSPNVIRDQDAFIMDLHADHAQNTEQELREQTRDEEQSSCVKFRTPQYHCLQ